MPIWVKAAPVLANRRRLLARTFRRFFLRGLAAILPTLITLWLLVWAWNFLWTYLGQYILLFLGWIWENVAHPRIIPFNSGWSLRNYLDNRLPSWGVQAVGVALAILTVYIAGLIVGNFIGRTAWRLAEMTVMKVPLIRAIYPAVKQVTDFVLAERQTQFRASRVVAVQPHEKGIWSIGLVTGAGFRALQTPDGRDMVTVFVPSSPTAFSGYVLVVPRDQAVELPLTVEEAMRLLVSGGVIVPGKDSGFEIRDPDDSSSLNPQQ
jgi:uncharacterized membrane protein